MDWNAAIEKNREALKRIVAALVSMAGLRGHLILFPPEGAPHQAVADAEKSNPSPALTPSLRACGGAATLPRRLHNAVLRLLRPAEAAARRLIIVAAREIVVTLPSDKRPDKRPATVYFFPRKSSAISKVCAGGKKGNCPQHPAPRQLGFPLLDPPRQPFRRRVRYVPAHAGPRICVPGYTERYVLPPPPPPPSPDDPLDATRVGLRIQALGRVLDDLPGQARRFARWRARRDSAIAQERNPRDAAGPQKMTPNTQNRGRVRRISPLKPGGPPGLPRRATRLRPFHEVHDVLRVTHGLAFWALERRDTS